MKKSIFCWFVISLLSCAPESVIKTPPPPPDQIEPAKIYANVPVANSNFEYGDISKAKVGEYVIYKTATPTSMEILEIRVVKASGENIWVEIIKQTDNINFVLIQLVSPEGNVLESYYQEPPKPPVKQEIKKIQPPENEWLERLASDKKMMKITTRIGEIDTIYEEVTFLRKDGSTFEKNFWWSGNIPSLFMASDFGGLVKLQADDQTIELIGFGTDATPKFPLPEK